MSGLTDKWARLNGFVLLDEQTGLSISYSENHTITVLQWGNVSPEKLEDVVASAKQYLWRTSLLLNP